MKWGPFWDRGRPQSRPSAANPLRVSWLAKERRKKEASSTLESRRSFAFFLSFAASARTSDDSLRDANDSTCVLGRPTSIFGLSNNNVAFPRIKTNANDEIIIIRTTTRLLTGAICDFSTVYFWSCRVSQVRDRDSSHDKLWELTMNHCKNWPREFHMQYVTIVRGLLSTE